MDGGNLLSGSVETLNEIKKNLLELRGYQTNSETLSGEEEKLEKSINSLEKSITEEIQTTTKKRRDEIEDTFDKQIDKIRTKMKRTKEKRDKRKNAKMSERIDMETAPIKGENKNLKIEAKALLQQKHIPSFCNTKLFYALYSPSCFTDLFITLIAIAVILLALPCGIYFLVLPSKKILYLIIIYVITVLIFGGLYLIIAHNTKDKYQEDIKQIKALRKNIRSNKKKIAGIKKNIKKDRDESGYGLQNFDEEITKLEKEASDILVQKMEALDTFDNTTSKVIASEIQGMNEEKLTGLKETYEKTNSEVKNNEDKIKALTIKIASEYEPLIGKDLMTVEKLDSLTNIIQAGNAGTVSEAIAVYRQGVKTE